MRKPEPPPEPHSVPPAPPPPIATMVKGTGHSELNPEGKLKTPLLVNVADPWKEGNDMSGQQTGLPIQAPSKHVYGPGDVYSCTQGLQVDPLARPAQCETSPLAIAGGATRHGLGSQAANPVQTEKSQVKLPCRV